MRSTTRGPMGLNLGDIIVGAGGVSVKDETDLFDALELYQPGDQVDVQVLIPASRIPQIEAACVYSRESMPPLFESPAESMNNGSMRAFAERTNQRCLL